MDICKWHRLIIHLNPNHRNKATGDGICGASNPGERSERRPGFRPEGYGFPRDDYPGQADAYRNSRLVERTYEKD